jgi:hypothetical protein
MKMNEKAIKPGRCPLWSSNQELADLNEDLKRLPRRLRRDLQRCQTCPKYYPEGSGAECAAMEVFQRQVQTAVQLVSVELGLFQDGTID